MTVRPYALLLPLLLGACVHRPPPPPAPPRLVLLSARRPLQLPPEVLEEIAGQSLVVRCLITERGETTDCRVLRDVPQASAAVMEHVLSGRYQPPTYRGRPVSIDYTFTFLFAVPPPKPVPGGGGAAPEPAAPSAQEEVVEADPTRVLPPDVVDAAAGQTLSLRCLITAAGTAQNCRALQGPAAAAAGAARYLEARRFRPMMLGDSPVSMERTFTFRFKAQE